MRKLIGSLASYAIVTLVLPVATFAQSNQGQVLGADDVSNAAAGSNTGLVFLLGVICLLLIAASLAFVLIRRERENQ